MKRRMQENGTSSRKDYCDRYPDVLSGCSIEKIQESVPYASPSIRRVSRFRRKQQLHNMGLLVNCNYLVSLEFTKDRYDGTGHPSIKCPDRWKYNGPKEQILPIIESSNHARA